MTPPDWSGDRELARQRFLRSVALALEVLPARDLNLFCVAVVVSDGLKGQGGAASGVAGLAEGGASEGAAEGGGPTLIHSALAQAFDPGVLELLDLG